MSNRGTTNELMLWIGWPIGTSITFWVSILIAHWLAEVLNIGVGISVNIVAGTVAAVQFWLLMGRNTRLRLPPIVIAYLMQIAIVSVLYSFLLPTAFWLFAGASFGLMTALLQWRFADLPSRFIAWFILLSGVAWASGFLTIGVYGPAFVGDSIGITVLLGSTLVSLISLLALATTESPALYSNLSYIGRRGFAILIVVSAGASALVLLYTFGFATLLANWIARAADEPAFLGLSIGGITGSTLAIVEGDLAFWRYINQREELNQKLTIIKLLAEAARYVDDLVDPTKLPASIVETRLHELIIERVVDAKPAGSPVRLIYSIR